MLFQIATSDKLEPIREKEFKLEKEIQQMTEKNLKAIFGLEFIRSEFTFGDFRIDTLAFDQSSKAFVLIEYKRDKNFSVIDQGYAYLSLLLNNKADFVLEYSDKFKVLTRKEEIDWSQTKVIFVAPSFTTYQKEAINFKDLPIELWEVRRYTNYTVSFSEIQKAGAKESIKTISNKDEAIEKVIREIKTYTEDALLSKASEETKELYEALKANVLNFGEVEVKPTKLYIAFKSGANFADVHIQQRGLKLWLNLTSGNLEDPKKLARDVSKTGHWGNGDYEIQISNDEHLDYLLGLIKQSYKINKK